MMYTKLGFFVSLKMRFERPFEYVPHIKIHIDMKNCNLHLQ